MAQDESVLVREAQAGNDIAFEELIKRHEKTIFRLCLRIIRVPQDAEDALQETFLKAYEHLGEFQGKSSFSTWLSRIAINEVLMKLRRRRSDNAVSIEDVCSEDWDGKLRDFADDRPDPEQTLIKAEMRNVVKKAVMGLPPTLRFVSLLRYVEDLSTRETAELLNESVPGVKARLFRARLRLTEELGKVLNGNGNGQTRTKRDFTTLREQKREREFDDSEAVPSLVECPVQ